MDKKIWPYLLLIGVIIVLLVIISWLSPKPVDWTPSFNARDKIPFGLYVLDHEIDSLFGMKVEKNKTSLKKYLEGISSYEAYDYEDAAVSPVPDTAYADEEYTEEDENSPEQKDTTIAQYDSAEAPDTAAYTEDEITEYGAESMLIIDRKIEWSADDVKLLMGNVNSGHEVLLSTAEMPELLLNYAGAVVRSPAGEIFEDTTAKAMVTLTFESPSLSKVRLSSGKWLSGTYFESLTTTETEILGHVETEGKKHPNFLLLKYGKGKLYLHLEPVVFTNYFMLKDSSYRYAENVLSYIHGDNYITWLQEGQSVSESAGSALRFIMSQPGLKWAWYLALAGTLLFMLVNARRSQRIIKTLPKPSNTSVEFARTIGNLYHLDGNIRKIIDNKIMYFLEKIRSDFHVNTEALDDSFVHQLQIRSGKSEKAIRQVVFLIHKHQQFDYDCNEGDLVRINEAIEYFYK